MNQSALDFSSSPMTIGRARLLRDEAMARVTEATERKNIGWSDVAYQFLANYARTHEFINPEIVLDAALAWGLSEPKDQRVFGSVILRAKRSGLIERSDRMYQRRKGHATETRGWRSKVFA